MKRKNFSKIDGLKYGWLQNAKKLFLLFVVVFFLLHLLIGISFVKGDSMESTLHNGEMVVYTRIHSNYHRGDVVSVKVPSGEYYVKRVIAVAGDTINITDGKVILNGEILEEDYVQGITQEEGDLVRYPLTLQEGQIFVMGDNRDVSMDSRSFGVVGNRQIRGKLLFHAGWLYLKIVK